MSTARPELLAAVQRDVQASRYLALTTATTVSLLLLSPASALAAAAAKPTGDDVPLDLGGDTAGSQQPGTGSGSIARVIVGLLIVVAVIYGVTWLLKELKGGGGDKTPSGEGLEQLTSLPLQGGGALSLVRVGDELLRVGSGANGATTLRRYEEDEARALGLWPDDDADPSNPEGPAAGGSGGGNVLVVLGRTITALRARTIREPGGLRTAGVQNASATSAFVTAPSPTAAPTTPTFTAPGTTTVFTAPGAAPAPTVDAASETRATAARATFTTALLDRLRAMTVRG
jgi:flagellar protein FliO/FliZ